jgi:hypothetical protein
MKILAIICSWLLVVPLVAVSIAHIFEIRHPNGIHCMSGNGYFDPLL